MVYNWFLMWLAISRQQRQLEHLKDLIPP